VITYFITLSVANMDDVLSLDTLYGDEHIPEELYRLVRDGLCSQLDAQLHDLTNSIEYLKALSWHGEEQVSLLMVAALNGYDDIVRVLLTHCDPVHQVELKGQIVIAEEDKCIHGATALYCACYRGHFTVAKTLIELGQANLNQDTYDYRYYSIFIHASIMNRLDIVSFLLENEYANVNGTKSYDADESTALIWAAFRGHATLVKYLIENGADVNYSCRNRNVSAPTPLTCAALRGHLESVQLLYNAGADANIKNNLEETLLTTAVKHKYYSIINFLLEQSINTMEDLELAACDLISHRLFSNEKMNTVFELLKLALQRRELLDIPKVCIQSTDVYDYKQECRTVDELNDIKNDPHRIFIEILLIRERIYTSRPDIKLLEPLENYGDKLMAEEEFIKCLNVYLHVFYLRQKTSMETNICGFVCLFCKMLTENQRIPIDRFIQVCYLTFEPSQSKHIEMRINNALFLVIIATKVI
jgi:ankyrin repeat protein